MKRDGFDTPFQNCIRSFHGPVRSYDPFPGILTSGLQTPDPLRERLIRDGESYLHKPYSQISAGDYMQFVRTGNRSDFESLYFSRRFQLCSLITAELAEDKDRFIEDIINGIYCICSEISWVLPAHNTYIRDTPQLILPDSKRPVLDLFACESAALLAMTYYLMKDKLDRVSVMISKHILDTVNDRLVIPYLNEHFWWMGNGDEPMCNWTPWCTQNALIAISVLPLEDDIRQKAVKQAAYSLDCFLKDYGEDGCCDEGAQYYRHAGLCLFHCFDILNAVTAGAFAGIPEMPVIKNIAAYIVNVHAGGDYYINFSDCSAKAGRMGVREFLFGRACDLKALMYAASVDVLNDYSSGDLFSDDSMKMNLYYRLLSAVYINEVLEHAENKPDKAFCAPRDIFYPSVGLMVARSPRFVLAAKAGDNADNHNHNDTGSFILYLDKKPLFVDIGVETYSKKTFSKDRYDIWTMQSGYHNLPTISGLDQRDGESFRATNVDCQLQDVKKTITMHIEKAYPLQDKSSEDIAYIRCITLDASEEIFTLKDTTNCSDVILNFITYEPMTATDSQDTLTLMDALVTFSGASVMTVETLPITDARLALAWDHDLYRTRLKMKTGEFTMQVRPAT